GTITPAYAVPLSESFPGRFSFLKLYIEKWHSLPSFLSTDIVSIVSSVISAGRKRPLSVSTAARDATSPALSENLLHPLSAFPIMNETSSIEGGQPFGSLSWGKRVSIVKSRISIHPSIFD